MPQPPIARLRGREPVEARNPDTCEARRDNPAPFPELFLGRDTEVIAINCKKLGVDRFPLGPRDQARGFPAHLFQRPIPPALLGRGPRKPGVHTYSSSEPCTRVASNSVTTVTPGTGSSITSTITVSAAASPCGGGPGALVPAFFVTAPF